MNDKLEEIQMYEYTCTPRKKSDIRSVVITVVAKDEEDARKLFEHAQDHFFEQDMNIISKVTYKGFRQKE